MPDSHRSAAFARLSLASVLLVGCTSGSTSESSNPATSDAGQTDAPPPGQPVARELFGTHVGLLASGTQPLPPRAGAIRLWDAGVAWRELEPQRGQINWALLDQAVAEAESTGATDIMWVHGSPPQWAAKDPESTGLYGPGSASPPKPGAYLDILGQIAERYRGRITSYQAWNEANISIFYQGSAANLARLTGRAREVLAQADPDALLLGASTTVREAGPVKAWYGKYTAALADQGWPVDAMAVHLYPRADEGAETRAGYVRTMRAWLAERGWTGPVWDTEVNYGDRRDFATEKVTVPQDVAVGWVARTYIDSLALGVQRVYWYSWNDHILGIDQIDPGTGEILPAGQAYLTVQDWFDGAYWEGCTGELMQPTGDPGSLTTCTLTTRDGTPAQILFTNEGTTTIPTPQGAGEVCRLDGACAPISGDELEVTPDPILLRSAG